jgi:hypothetical protein
MKKNLVRDLMHNVVSKRIRLKALLMHMGVENSTVEYILSAVSNNIALLAISWHTNENMTLAEAFRTVLRVQIPEAWESSLDYCLQQGWITNESLIDESKN